VQIEARHYISLAVRNEGGHGFGVWTLGSKGDVHEKVTPGEARFQWNHMLSP
jgi:hypothetical protein